MTGTGETPTLEAKSVRHEYGDLSVLDDVSLTVEAGTVAALIGPNGSGKTTLLRALTGLLEPTGGTIAYRGPETARRIGYLPQHPAFRSGFTTLETLSHYATLVGEDEDDARRRLERVGLGDAADRRVEALSGGMTRLLGIAQATVGDPPVVILDEPGSGLDPGMRVHVFDVARELAADGTAVLVSSHSLDLVERSADALFLLAGGRIVEQGSPAAVRDRYGADSLLAVYEASISGDVDRVRVRGEPA